MNLYFQHAPVVLALLLRARGVDGVRECGRAEAPARAAPEPPRAGQGQGCQGPGQPGPAG